MKTAVVSAMWLLTSGSALADPQEILGTASCARSGHGGPCRIAWNFSETQRTYYWLQRFDPAGRSWQNVEAAVTDPYATSKNAVVGGSLYRVRACNDLAATKECVSSTVHWAPVRPESAEDIPELVRARSGTYQVSKNLPLWSQTYQYNVYLVTQLVESVDVSLLPAMTAPPEAHPDQFQSSELTDDDLLHGAIHEIFEGKRQQGLAARGDVSGTAR